MELFCCVVDESFVDEDFDEAEDDVVFDAVQGLVLVRFLEVDDCVASCAVFRSCLVEFSADATLHGLEVSFDELC